MRPFSLVKVNDHTIIVNEKDIYITASIQRAAIAPGQNTASIPPSSSFYSRPSQVEELKSKKIPTEYAIDGIVGHQGKKNS